PLDRVAEILEVLGHGRGKPRRRIVLEEGAEREARIDLLPELGIEDVRGEGELERAAERIRGGLDRLAEELDVADGLLDPAALLRSEGVGIAERLRSALERRVDDLGGRRQLVDPGQLRHGL